MKPLTVVLMRIARGLTERCEVGTWLADCYCQALQGKCGRNLDLLLHGIVDACPTPAARNTAVIAARNLRADVLIQVDEDMLPSPTFFVHAIEFLARNKGSVVIGSPYCGAAPGHHVHVTRLSNFERFTREEAEQKRGDELVGCIGTGLLAARMEAFETAGVPWFDYEYTNETRDAVGRTEDFYFCRRLVAAGGRIYCAWDHWSGHAKVEIVQKPESKEEKRGQVPA